MPTKVAIVGTAPSSKMLAPYGDDSWQIWACSAGNMNQLPRVNIWFEMHAIAEMMAPENRAMAEPFFAWLKEKSDAENFQVVMLEAGTAVGGIVNTFVPKAIPYPRDEMIRLFGRNWFTSSVAYMMALAIARGAEEIGLFGVDMAADVEHYSAQRAGCTRFIEIAEERGIKVHVPMESCLKTAAPMYGYWEGTPFGRRINATIQMVQGAYSQKVAQRDQLNLEINYFGGALEQLRYFQRTWVDGAELDVDLGHLPAMLKAQQEAEGQAAKAVSAEESALEALVAEAKAVTVGAAEAAMADVVSAYTPLAARMNGSLAEETRGK